MPCVVFDVSENINFLKDDVRFLKGALCGIATVLEARGILDSVVIEVDWKEAGIKQLAFFEWWENHKEIDNARRKREMAKQEADNKRAIALSKLTKEERELLGIK